MRTVWPWRFGNDVELSTFPGVGLGLSVEVIPTRLARRWHVQFLLCLPLLMLVWDLRVWRSDDG